MGDVFTILLVGGYGTFGGRIAELLEDDPRLVLIIAGRSLEKATAYCRARGTTRATLVPATFDRAGDIAAQLTAAHPDLLVDASGPFQAYGADRYRLVKHCIAQRIDYLDLADGAEFVAGIGECDAAARAAGCYVLAGVSSFPVLTAAVVRVLSGSMARIDAIRAGIAPSPYARVGGNVIRAIAGYAGAKIMVRRDGADRAGYPFTEHMRFTIAPPGAVPLRSTLFSLVDVPDLRLLPALWPEVRTVWMGAGPVPEILHRALIALAWLVRWGVIRSLSPLAALMHGATNILSWGEHRGGMFVAVDGVDAAGVPVHRDWHMLAEGDDGPFIPSMAVVATIRRVLDGRPPAPGARAATDDLDLADYETLFAERNIRTAIRDATENADKRLYVRLLGSAWARLPQPIQAMHDITGTATATGRARVERGGILAQLVASIVGFPAAAPDIPVTVRFETDSRGETWIRQFGDQVFSSRQFAGRDRSDALLCERFGPLTFVMAVVTAGERLTLVLRRWSVFGIHLPMWLCPRANSYEHVEDGRFRFHVEIRHPLVGLIIGYRGYLEPPSTSA